MMNIFATSLIIFLGLSHSSAREIPRTPDVSAGDGNRPYIPIPSVDEVWRKPIFGRSPFLDPDNDFVEFVDDSSLPKTTEESDSYEPNDIAGRKNAENDVDNHNANSDEDNDDNIKKNEEDTEDNNDKDRDEDKENTNISDEEEDQSGVGEDINNDEEEKDQDGDKDDEILNDRKKEHDITTVPPFFYGGYASKNPYFNLKKMTNYLRELERALEQVFRQTMKEAALLNGTFANTTEEKVDINGQQFLVQKSVIKTGDNNSSIYIEAVDVLPEPETNRTKRSNFWAEKAQKVPESDP